jgi:O-antigen ligase
MDRLGEVYERRDLRMRFIREGLVIVQDNLVLGVGPGRYGGAASAIVPSPVYEEYESGLYGFRTVHNFWLHLLGEVGVIGTSIFLAIVAGLMLRFHQAARGARAAADPVAFIIFAGAGTAVAITAVNNATEMIFEGNFPSFVIWLVVGLVSVLAPPAAIFRRRPAQPPPASAG